MSLTETGATTMSTVQTECTEKTAKEIFLLAGEYRKDRLTSLQHLPSLSIFIFQGGQACGYYFCIPTVSTKCNAERLYLNTKTHTLQHAVNNTLLQGEIVQSTGKQKQISTQSRAVLSIRRWHRAAGSHYFSNKSSFRL